MITRIEATRYRCLERVAVDLPSFCVLVGANGAGKSTFLDIPGLLGDCLKQRDVATAFITRQDERAPRCSTLRELIFCGQGDDFILAIEARLPDEVIRRLLPSQGAAVQSDPKRWLTGLRYEIRLELFNERWLAVRNEYLFLFSESTTPGRGEARLHGEVSPRREWRFIIRREYGGEAEFRVETQARGRARAAHVDETMLALPRAQFESGEDFPAASWILDLLVGGTLFYHPDLERLKRASPPGLSPGMMADAANLPWLAMGLMREDAPRYALWIEHVRTALPQIREIRVREREEDHHAYFVVTYASGHEVTSSGLSEGTLQILAHTLLPYLNNLPALILTEEPENGIHPRAIEAVLQSLSSVYDAQVLVSSHSPVVLAHCKLDQLLCSRLEENGAATLMAGNRHPRLAQWRGQVDLGALFAAGVLG
ncbi:MAG: AAA family ATPase [Magnetococcales bacterium]|nr:AAA family ATPase [Magnetococcales bacterium]MBF0151601.1 AAA family ATPase [Magnetococcales bacterium]MBF0631724.1 AAA family ATPase [Magnetococcales bacterium]